MDARPSRFDGRCRDVATTLIHCALPAHDVGRSAFTFRAKITKLSRQRSSVGPPEASPRTATPNKRGMTATLA
ncbi:hypothetical protein MRX96_039759 [Rhipicephalus microplus]